MSICIVDTSILCELLDVPHKCAEHGRFLQEFESKAKSGEQFLLPITAIIETGNHIAHIQDGTLRRRAADTFVKFVRAAVEGHSPFHATSSPTADELRGWLQDFPNDAMRGVGMGDKAIVQEWERQGRINKRRRIYVWSLDVHLSAYDRAGDFAG